MYISKTYQSMEYVHTRYSWEIKLDGLEKFFLLTLRILYEPAHGAQTVAPVEDCAVNTPK